jgi:CO/xanthine dehydrogenase Mo-binding subunit
MSPAHVRVIACPNGGGFGGKSDPFGHEIVVAKLSMKTGRPVKITLTREEVFYCHRGRHPVKMWVKTGLKKDGSITAMHFRSALDGGGYGSYGVASLYYTGALQTVTTRSPRTSSREPASSRTSRPAAPSAATARRSRASPWSATSTSSATTWAWTRGSGGSGTRSRPGPSPRTR